MPTLGDYLRKQTGEEETWWALPKIVDKPADIIEPVGFTKLQQTSELPFQPKTFEQKRDEWLYEKNIIPSKLSKLQEGLIIPEKREPSLWEKANLIVDRIGSLPEKLVGKTIQMLSGGESGASVVNKDWGYRFIKNLKENKEEAIKDMYIKYGTTNIFKSVDLEDIDETIENLSYSIATMGVGIPTGVGVSFLATPVIGYAAGMIVGGKAAYEMTSYEIMQQILEIKDKELKQKRGKGLTLEEENQLKDRYGYLAKKYGLWEAIPEAVGSAFGIKALTAPLTKMVGKNVATQVIDKIFRIYGEEFFTETTTQMGQKKLEFEAGLPGGEIRKFTSIKDWAKSFKEIAPQTFALTTIMAGAGQTIISTKTAINKIQNSLTKELIEKGFSSEDAKAIASQGGYIGEIPKPPKGYEGEGKGKLSKSEAEMKITPIEQAEGEVWMELDTAEAGKRIMIDAGDQISETQFMGIKSTFPEWIPEDLRRKDLVNKVMDYMEKGVEPAKGKVKELYDIVKQEIANRAGVPIEEIAKPTEITSATKKSLENKARELIREATVGKAIPSKTVIRETTGQIKPGMKEFKQRMTDLVRGMREGRITTKAEIKGVQTNLIEMLEKAKLPVKDFKKFSRTIKNIQTQEQLKIQLPVIKERIVELAERQELREIREQAEKILSLAKPKSVGGKPVGKLTPETQQIFNRLREIGKMNITEAETRLNSNIERYQNEIAPPEIALENKILALKTQYRHMDSVRAREILSDLEALYQEGRIGNALKEFNFIEEMNRLKGFAIDRITKNKGLLAGRETTGAIRKTAWEKMKAEFKTIGKDLILDWGGKMQVLDFNTPIGQDSFKKTFSIIDQENRYKELQAEYMVNLQKTVSEAYGVKNSSYAVGSKISNIVGEKIKLGTFKNADGVEVNLEFTRGELMYFYGQLLDPTVEIAFYEGNKYTPEIVSAIEKALTSQDKQMIQDGIRMYQEFHPVFNDVYREINGIDLPNNPNYAGKLQREGFQPDPAKLFGEFGEDINYRKALTSPSFIARVENIRPIAKQDFFAVMDRHFTELNYYTAWAERIRMFSKVFADPMVREAIKQEFTTTFLKSIDTDISDLISNGNRQVELYKPVEWFRRARTVGSLAGKAQIGIKQMVSTVAYLENLGPIEFSVGVADFWKNPIKNAKILEKESVFIRERKGNMERDIKAAMKTDEFARFRKTQSFINAAMLNVRLGDKGAIQVGSWAMRRAGIKKRQNLKDIIRAYEDFGNETQQSGDPGRLSKIQKGSSIEKLFTQFMSSQRAYLQKEILAIKSIFREGGTSASNVRKVAKTIFIYHVLLPVLFQFLANFGRLDEDARKDYLRAGILGSFNGLFIFGSVVDSIVRTALGMRVFSSEVPVAGVADGLMKAIRAVKSDDITSEDIYRAIEGMAETGSATTGLPADATVKFSSGIYGLIQGDFKRGIGKILGWSEYSMGEEKKEKEKPLPKWDIPGTTTPQSQEKIKWQKLNLETKTESKPIAKEKTTEDLASEVAEFIKKMA